MTPFEIIQYAAAIFVSTCFLGIAVAFGYAVIKTIRKK